MGGEVLLAPGPMLLPDGVAQGGGEFRSVLTELPLPLLHPGRALSVWRQAAPPHSSNLGRRYLVVEVWVGSGAGAVVQVRVGIGTGTVVEVRVGKGTGTVVQVRVGMGTGAVVEVGW
ncbi:hypothetical protein BX264_6289 [Streptomyces sp. 2333.5]|nr:hypothetical protein BX264_6289 [Streptomyces sp. 2333.5]SEE84962.1 hypothetical protein SAMN05428943_6388 [Streptomyces sp. 2314.4]SEF04301.1 hypothetical protein SAMN05428942_6387 [Streptomyces sp. 2112.2]